MNESNEEACQRTGTEEPIALPGYFEDIQLDDLVLLIGEVMSLLSPRTYADAYIASINLWDLLADLLQRMIAHNDQIPLSA
ncbi:hypothetical protein FRC17_003868, partial [Serendipita sp. 399]